MRGPLVPRRREGRDPLVGEKGGGRVGERRLGLIHGRVSTGSPRPRCQARGRVQRGHVRGQTPDTSEVAVGGGRGRRLRTPRPGSRAAPLERTMSATETRTALPATSIRTVISSPRSAQPRATATIGFT